LKILFDARHIKDIYSGLARYTHSILKALMKSSDFSRLEIILDKNEDYLSNPLFHDIQSYKTNKISFVYLDTPLFKMKHHLNISSFVNNSDCDIYFYPHFDLPVLIKKKSIFVVHDLFPLVMDDYIIKHRLAKTFYFKNIISLNLLKKNTECIAVSNSTKMDILNLFSIDYKDKINVVYEDSFYNIAIKNNKPNIHIEKLRTSKYLLYIGDRRPHKNLKMMIDIFRILKNKYNYDGYFVIAGGERNFNINIENYTNNDNFIKLIGRVSDSELNNLYKNMDALFFLSKYEGFGLPIIESAKFNKKIITSISSSCGEISPINALKLNINTSISDNSSKIIKYLKSEFYIDNTLYLSRFSWDKSVEKIFFREEI
jgi:glycosyltransferase involved in cell wall biosynthesis